MLVVDETGTSRRAPPDRSLGREPRGDLGHQLPWSAWQRQHQARTGWRRRGVRVVTQPNQRHGVQRLVELAVAAAVEAVAGDLAGGGRDRAGPAKAASERNSRHATS